MEHDSNAAGDTLGHDMLCIYCIQSHPAAFHRAPFSHPLAQCCLRRQTLPDTIFKISSSVAIHCYSQLCPCALFLLWNLLKIKMIWFCCLITHLLAVSSYLNVSPGREGTLSFLILVCLQFPE